MRKRMTDKQLKSTYGPKIEAILGEIQAAVNATGMSACDPFDMHDDEWRWDIAVYRDANQDGEPFCDVYITIIESEINDGEKDGINFMLDAVEYGGRIIGGLCPYNYTEDIWVSRRDPEAVAERWRLFEDWCDPDTIVDSIVKAVAEKK